MLFFFLFDDYHLLYFDFNIGKKKGVGVTGCVTEKLTSSCSFFKHEHWYGQWKDCCCFVILLYCYF